MVEEQTAKLPVCRTMGSSISSLLGAAAAAASRHGLSAGCQVNAWLLHSRRLIEACTCIAATNTSHQNPPKVKKSVQHTDVAPGHTCACRRPRALAMWPAPKCGLAGPCSNPSRRSSLATGGEPRQSRVSVVAAPPPAAAAVLGPLTKPSDLISAGPACGSSLLVQRHTTRQFQAVYTSLNPFCLRAWFRNQRVHCAQFLSSSLFIRIVSVHPAVLLLPLLPL